ncbi:MAG: hypothetical protein IPK82_05315 [Polyangiaceae bacterium]|nr:hypothetical protein [Polyangiaceae bacterium]
MTTSNETHKNDAAAIKKVATAAQTKKPGVFAIVTLLLGLVAMSLIVWRIGKAWRIEYGNGPRGPRPIPTTGAFGAPGDVGRPPPPAASSK